MVALALASESSRWDVRLKTVERVQRPKPVPASDDNMLSCVNAYAKAFVANELDRAMKMMTIKQNSLFEF